VLTGACTGTRHKPSTLLDNRGDSGTTPLLTRQLVEIRILRHAGGRDAFRPRSTPASERAYQREAASPRPSICHHLVRQCIAQLDVALRRGTPSIRTQSQP
jgi:hypothetical protein